MQCNSRNWHHKADLPAFNQLKIKCLNESKTRICVPSVGNDQRRADVRRMNNKQLLDFNKLVKGNAGPKQAQPTSPGDRDTYGTRAAGI